MDRRARGPPTIAINESQAAKTEQLVRIQDFVHWLEAILPSLAEMILKNRLRERLAHAAKRSALGVAMMKIRKMRVRMFLPFVAMPAGVGLHDQRVAGLFVLMVGIMRVSMLVLDDLVKMFVLVSLS
jgi:hypothetical protein